VAGAERGAGQSKVSARYGVFVRRFADYAVAGKYVRWVLSLNNATVTDERSHYHGYAPACRGEGLRWVWACKRSDSASN
jgi:hypothetical protein